MPSFIPWTLGSAPCSSNSRVPSDPIVDIVLQSSVCRGEQRVGTVTRISRRISTEVEQGTDRLEGASCSLRQPLTVNLPSEVTRRRASGRSMRANKRTHNRRLPEGDATKARFGPSLGVCRAVQAAELLEPNIVRKACDEPVLPLISDLIKR